jgi:hypothetical protein
LWSTVTVVPITVTKSVTISITVVRTDTLTVRDSEAEITSDQVRSSANGVGDTVETGEDVAVARANNVVAPNADDGGKP